MGLLTCTVVTAREGKPPFGAKLGTITRVARYCDARVLAHAPGGVNPARRAVPNVYLRTSAASDPMQNETCIMSIRMMSIPAADMLKVACLAHRHLHTGPC